MKIILYKLSVWYLDVQPACANAALIYPDKCKSDSDPNNSKITI